MQGRSTSSRASSSVAPCMWPERPMPFTAASALALSALSPSRTASSAVHQLSGSCSDQPGCGRETSSEAVRLAMIRCVAVHQHRLDRGRADIEPEIHRNGTPPACAVHLRDVVANENVDANAFLPGIVAASPSRSAMSRRVALRASWPGSWLMIASIVPLMRWRRENGVSSWAMKTTSRPRPLASSAATMPPLPAPTL